MTGVSSHFVNGSPLPNYEVKDNCYRHCGGFRFALNTGNFWAVRKKREVSCVLFSLPFIFVGSFCGVCADGFCLSTQDTVFRGYFTEETLFSVGNVFRSVGCGVVDGFYWFCVPLKILRLVGKIFTKRAPHNSVSGGVYGSYYCGIFYARSSSLFSGGRCEVGDSVTCIWD